MVDDQHRSAAPAGDPAAHQTGGPPANDHDIPRFTHQKHLSTKTRDDDTRPTRDA